MLVLSLFLLFGQSPNHHAVLICGDTPEGAKAKAEALLKEEDAEFAEELSPGAFVPVGVSVNAGLWNAGSEEKGDGVYDDFWNDTYLMWELLYKNGWPDENIHVLYGDGEDWPNNKNPRYQAPVEEGIRKITDTSAYYHDVVDIFNALASGDPDAGIEPMGPKDNLFVWTFDHGAPANCIRILDITDPLNPREAGKGYIAFPVPACWRTFRKYLGCMDVYENYLYIVSGKEVIVLDISDFSNPKLISISPILGDRIFNVSCGVDATGALRYVGVVSTKDGQAYFHILSPDPYNPEVLATLPLQDPENPLTRMVKAYGLICERNRAWITGYYGGIADEEAMDVCLVDCSDLSSPYIANFNSNFISFEHGVDLTTKTFIPDGPAGTYLFVSVVGEYRRSWWAYVSIVNGGTLEEVGRVNYDNLWWIWRNPVIKGTYMFVVARYYKDYSEITIVDISDPAQPEVVSRWVPSSPYCVYAAERSGDYLFVAGNDVNTNAGVVFVLDISDPVQPQLVATYHVPDQRACIEIDIKGNYAFVYTSINPWSLAGADEHSCVCLMSHGMLDERMEEHLRGVEYNRRTFWMQQCFSGGFIDNLENENTVILTACRYDETAFRADDKDTAGNFYIENEEWQPGDTCHHGEFNFHVMNAVRQTEIWPYDNPPPVPSDLDGNRHTSMWEAFQWVETHDSWYRYWGLETPQYSDPGNIGSSTYLVWDDFKPPASPRGVTYTFGRIGDTLLIHFEWLMNKEIDFSGYRIYRNTALVGDVHDSVFCDTLPDFIPGDIDTYFVTSYDVYGYESTPISIEIRYPLGLLTSTEDLNFSSQNKLALAYNKWVYVYSDGGQTKGIASFDGHTWSRPVRIGHMRYPSLYVWAKLLFPNVLAHYWTAGNTGYKLWGADSMEWWSLLETSEPSLPEEWNYVLLEDYVDPTQPDPYPMPIAPSLALNSNGNICLAMLLNSFGEGSILYREYLRGDWNSPTEWEVVDSLVSMPWYPPSLVGYYGIHVVWGDKEDVYYSTRDLTGNWTQPWKINMLAFPAYEPSLSYKGDKLYCVWIEENTVTGKKRIAWQEGWLALPPEIRWAYTYPSYMEVDGDPHHPRMVEGAYLLFEMDGKVYLTDTTGNVIFTDKGYGPQAQYHDGEVHLVYGKTHGCEILTNTWISVAEIPFIAVKIGDSIPSPYVIERDGYLVYPSGISVDYDTEELMYEIPFLDTLYDYTLQIVGYHESSGIWKEKVKIDGKKGRMLRVKAGIPETLSIKIPFPYYRDDGKIVVTIERYTGDYASVASIALYAEERRSVRSGGPLASGTTEPKISFYARALRSMGGNAVIEYAVPHDSRVKIEIYDVVGRMVENHSGYRSAGVYRYTWSGKPGVYFYRIRAGEKEAKGRFMILK